MDTASWEKGGSWLSDVEDGARLERPHDRDGQTMAARGETVLR